MSASAPLELPEPQWAQLRAAYAAPPRAYHHFGHVQAVLGHYAEVADAVGWRQPREVYLAVLYHDAVYQAGRGDNEAQSARLAQAAIAQWLPDAGVDAARVVALIALTARHGQLSAGEVDAEAALFLDCDMAILGADPATFAAYDAAIAEEYRAVVPRWLYRRKRRAFLRTVLAQPRIFLSDWFHARYDAAARANLRQAIG
jgi:predicted metal-dependent HD superfamily phosphohydrolase